MVFDSVNFGYGLALVMAGYVGGLTISTILSIFKAAQRIVILLVPFLFFAAGVNKSDAAIITSIDCGQSSNLFIDNYSGASGDTFTIYGQLFCITLKTGVSIPCSGVQTVSIDNTKFHYAIVTDQTYSWIKDADNQMKTLASTFTPLAWGQSFSFLAGLLCAMAFVIAATKNWI